MNTSKITNYKPKDFAELLGAAIVIFVWLMHYLEMN